MSNIDQNFICLSSGGQQMSLHKQKLLSIIFIAIILLAGLSACNFIWEEGERYVLTLDMEGNGSLPGHSLGEVLYEDGTIVSFEPETQEDYILAGWKGPDADDVNKDNGSYTIIMDDNKEITAHFREETPFIKSGKFGITTEEFVETVDWHEKVDEIFGSEYRVADWYDLVEYYEEGGDIESLLDSLEIMEGKWYSPTAYVTKEGEKISQGEHHYFIKRHNHDKRPGWYAHDDIDNHLVSLGNYYDRNERILAVKKDADIAGVTERYTLDIVSDGE